MRSLGKKAILSACSALWLTMLCVGAASADSANYVYRGNNFDDIQGEPGIFSTNDRVTGRFTVDCSVAHMEGTCANLPFADYFALGAVDFESINFSAGPATLPTAEGFADITAFHFSTDSNGQIVDWDIDLSLFDPTGIINVDTDNNPVPGPIDSAAALDGFANVYGDPGKWRRLGPPGKGPTPHFKTHSRTYGNDVGANVCVEFSNVQRCADLFASENYDVQGTYRYTDLWINYWFYRAYPEGGWRQGWRWMSCQVGMDAIKAHQNGVTFAAVLDPNGPECFSEGFREDCDAEFNCEVIPWPYVDPTEVTGEWMEPLNTIKNVVNQTFESFDPWSGASSRTMSHCIERGGELMNQGGFWIGNREFVFEGQGTPGWSHYWLRSCNDKYSEN